MTLPSLRWPILALASLALTPLASAEVTLKEEGDKVTVNFDGKLFTEYHFKGARRPYFYPVIGATGAGMTRNWPMKEGVPGEEADHPHHMGLWYGHRSVNGAGFWENSGKPDAKLGQMVHDKFVEIKGGADQGTIKDRNKWVLDNSGELVCTDERTITFHQTKGGPMLDFVITITAGEKDVVFGDDKDGTMAIRVPESMRVEKARPKGEKVTPPGEGHIVTSEGKKDKEAWGTRGAWCDYYGPVEGKTAGVAIFDNPKNPRFPTWWHVRTYGLFAANPFAQAQFEKLPDKEAGAYKVPAGQSVTFSYRFYFHEGDTEQAKVAERYKDYTATVK
jgi:hypothetical protein